MNTRYLPDTHASAYLGERWGIKASPRTMANWRWRGQGPLFYKAGRFIRYREEELDAFARGMLGELRASTGSASEREDARQPSLDRNTFQPMAEPRREA